METISAVILAGGSGGSFSPISQYMPKSLAFIGDKPLIHHILDSLDDVPIDKIYIVLGKFGDMIRRYVLDMRSIHHCIEFVTADERHKIGGCLLSLKSMITNTFLVYYGDILLENFDFNKMLAFHRNMKAQYDLSGTLAFSRSYPLNVGIVSFNSEHLLLQLREKPKDYEFNVNMAISLFEPRLFSYVDDTSDDLFGTVVPRALGHDERFAVFEHSDRWWHIHTVADLYSLVHHGHGKR